MPRPSTTTAILPAMDTTRPYNVQAFSLKALMPGDANYDGKVDINDLTIVLASYNQSGKLGRRAISTATARSTSTT